MSRTVTVGFDGSRESLAAVDWAAGEAVRRAVPLRLLQVWSKGDGPRTRLVVPATAEGWGERALGTAEATAPTPPGSADRDAMGLR
ncbi:universal stress protein [Streptomyces avidinii]|uniref:universal stress protein n=1 Tax=Streptomyces avidinii TaxID=1895 RepID=UPI003869086E|nr:universal stress protein [Streptomyces avidinii]